VRKVTKYRFLFPTIYILLGFFLHALRSTSLNQCDTPGGLFVHSCIGPITQLLVLLILPGIWVFFNFFILGIFLHVDLFQPITLIGDKLGWRSDGVFVLLCFPVGILLSFFIGYFIEKLRVKRGLYWKFGKHHRKMN
jgi:hypothetical protein